MSARSFDEDENERSASSDGIVDDPRYDQLDRPRRDALRKAQARWEEEQDAFTAEAEGRELVWPGDGTGRICGIPVKRGIWAGQDCKNPAGHNTVHAGYGPCFVHGGAKFKGRAEGAWVAAHAFGQQLNINPFDALLMAVRIAAGKVAYIEHVIGTASSDLELEGRVRRLEGENGDPGLLMHPDTGQPLGVGQFRDLSFWVEQSEKWHDRLAKTAKMAVDAGIAAYEIQKVEAEAQRMARVLNAVIDGLEDVIDDTVALRMRSLMRKELLAIEAEETGQASLSERRHSEDEAVVDSTGTWGD